MRGGKVNQVQPKQQTFADDGFDLQDFYGTKKKEIQVQQIQDEGFSLDEFYGKPKKPVAPAQPVFQDDGMSYSDFMRGGVKQP